MRDALTFFLSLGWSVVYIGSGGNLILAIIIPPDEEKGRYDNRTIRQSDRYPLSDRGSLGPEQPYTGSEARRDTARSGVGHSPIGAGFVRELEAEDWPAAEGCQRKGQQEANDEIRGPRSIISDITPHMAKIPFNPNEDGALEAVRTIVLERLRRDQNWNQLNQYDLSSFNPYVEYSETHIAVFQKFLIYVQDVFWELITQGVLAPGIALDMPNLPWFHITDYGRKVLKSEEPIPHDPTGYLQHCGKEIGAIDATVEAYLRESLNCFVQGCYLASMMMLGIASERVFLLLCGALWDALAVKKEKSDFEAVLACWAMKPKQDWVQKKFESLPKGVRKQLPDNVGVMLTTVFDFIRVQRNDLGHPRQDPPSVGREEAFIYLRMFPRYYKTVNQAIRFLASNKV
jgi:hypothetical protein